MAYARVQLMIRSISYDRYLRIPTPMPTAAAEEPTDGGDRDGDPSLSGAVIEDGELA
jgi:hypothetical protein